MEALLKVLRGICEQRVQELYRPHAHVAVQELNPLPLPVNARQWEGGFKFCLLELESKLLAGIF